MLTEYPFSPPDADPEDEGKYSIEISNESGSAAATFGVRVRATPGKPTGPLGVSDVTNATCKLRWRPPTDDGGARVTHYVVERREAGKPFWTTVASYCKDLELDVQGLYENKEYDFRVAAVNENGTGEYLQGDSSIVAKWPFGEHSYL